MEIELLKLGLDVWILGPDGPKEARITGVHFSAQESEGEIRESEVYVVSCEGNSVQVDAESIFLDKEEVNDLLDSWIIN